MHSDQESIRKTIKTYWMIGAALFVFTGITVAVNQVHLAIPLAITLALIIATAKGSMVASVFMHLSHERKWIYGALILTHLIVGLPIIIWVMISFFEDVPADLEDAALIDGCSYFSAFWRIALPLVKPGVVATAILSFVFSWNNFLFSVILAGRSTRTLPIAVYTMISYEEINWGTLAAAATLITLPVLLVALLAQRHIVSGLTFGAVKQ